MEKQVKNGAVGGQPDGATEPHTPARKRSIAPLRENRSRRSSSLGVKGERT